MLTINPISALLGKTFYYEGVPNIGNIIETSLGGTVNCSHSADLGEWEVKSRWNGAKAWMTLGSKKTSNPAELLDQVYLKIKNVILVEYDRNDDNSFTVTSVTLLYELDKQALISAYGVTVKPELRENNTIMTLKVKSDNLKKLYGRKVIEYKSRELTPALSEFKGIEFTRTLVLCA
jgi:hypothetical protein